MTLNDLIVRSRDMGISELIIKRGAEPCIIDYRQQLYHVEAVRLASKSVVDTTAAGDSFNGGYFAMRFAGHNPVVSARYAHQRASMVIQHCGAILDLALMLNIDRFSKKEMEK